MRVPKQLERGKASGDGRVSGEDGEGNLHGNYKVRGIAEITRDSELNSRWGTICTPTGMKASDGKIYKTAAATTEGILRLIQSIPSPKAESFKLWLAQIGRERLEETIDPKLTIDRALSTYLKKGYSKEWINQRLQTV